MLHLSRVRHELPILFPRAPADGQPKTVTEPPSVGWTCRWYQGRPPSRTTLLFIVEIVDARTREALQGAIAEHVGLEYKAVLPQDSDRT